MGLRLRLLVLMLHLRLLLGAPKAMALESNLGSTGSTSYQITVHIAVYGDLDRLIDRKLTLMGSARSLLCITIGTGRPTALDRLLSLGELLAAIPHLSWRGAVEPVGY